ncbi:MAG TPA: cation:proton antiporter, partial [Pseudonocardiaceae bacterium]
DTLLETFVFAYMGLQCKFIFTALTPSGLSWPSFVVGAVLVLLAVLLIRPLWIFLTYGRALAVNGLLRRILGAEHLVAKARRREQRRERHNLGGPPQAEYLTWRYLTVISWTGMRGVVTLAAAAGIPSSFPHRDVIQALAFVVAVGTLLIQGPTLPPLIRALNISAPEEREYEAESVHNARLIIRSATERTMRDIFTKPPEGVDPQLLVKYKTRISTMLAARRESDDTDQETVAEQAGSPFREATRTMRRTMLAAQRQALTEARDKGELDEDVTRRELERLDYEEAAAWWSSTIDE